MSFKDILKIKMDAYVHFIYQITRNFPVSEIYGATSQIRRASMSVILNYIEGYARFTNAQQINFFQISYGSLKESKYLLHFSMVEKYISLNEYKEGLAMSEEIGAMLWTEISNLREKQH